MSIYQKLGAIQKELIAPKGQYNSFGKYPYRSCEDILKAVKPLCDAQNTVLYITNDLQQIGDRNYVKAVVRLVDLESGETIECVAHAREEHEKKGMDGSQITGASSSYARKYALAGLFCIDNEKDSDATNTGSKPAESASTQKPTDAQMKAFYAELNRTGVPAQVVLKDLKIKSVDEMSAAGWKSAMERLKATPNKG